MKKGWLVIIAILGIVWIIGWITGGDKSQTSNQTETGKVAYTCIWCQKIFVGDEGDLSCYYYDKNAKGCGYHTVNQNTNTGFCTIAHCDLYKLANNNESTSTTTLREKCTWCKIGHYVNGLATNAVLFQMTVSVN